MAGIPGLDDALRNAPAEKLDQECSSDDLNEISQSLTRWPEVSPWLGLTEADEEDIRARNDRVVSGLARERIDVLRKWKEKQEDKATYRSLIEAFYHAQRLDLVDVAIELLQMPSTSQDTPTLSQPSHLCPSLPQCSALIEYGEYLKERYREDIPIFSIQWPPLPVQKAFNLAMIRQTRIQHGEICDEHIRMIVAGKVNDILHMKSPVKLEDIFQVNCMSRKVILIEGAPGAGKSTLSWDICKKWGAGELFQEYEAVILVRLRDPEARTAKTLADLLPAKDDAMAESVASQIGACEGRNVLFILDGWDELPCTLQGMSIYQQFIMPQAKAYLRKCAVIVTSRPISSGELHPLVSSRIEIIGFTPEQLRQYFSNCLGGDSQAVDALLERVEENPVVASSCYLPLTAAITAHLFLSGNQTLPTTLHGIFSSLVLCCLARFQRERVGLKGEAANLESLDRLPKGLQEPFRQLCTLAFLGVLEDRVTFNSTDLEALDIHTDVSALGLLQALPSIVPRKVSVYYNFLHLQIQELLAAYHIASLSDSEQIYTLQRLFHLSRFAPVFQFYAGITQFQSQRKYLSKVAFLLPKGLAPTGIRDVITNIIRSDSKQLVVSVIRCLFEADDPSLCRFVADQLYHKGVFMMSYLDKTVTPIVLDLSGTVLSPLDCLSVGYFLSCVCATTRSNRDFAVTLDDCSIDNHSCKFLIRGLSKCPNPSRTTSGRLRVNLAHNSIHDEGAHYIAHMLRSCSIVRELNLNANNLGDSGVKSLAEALHVNDSLTVLWLFGNDAISERGLSVLTEHFKSNRRLVKLVLPSCFRPLGVQESINSVRRQIKAPLITVK